MNTNNNKTTNQEPDAKNGITSGNTPASTENEKVNFSSVRIKELIAKEEMQKAIRRYVDVPEVVVVKELRKPFENKETKDITQKVKAVSGTTIEDFAAYELTLFNTELDPVKAVNKKYRIIDYTFGLDANMSAGKFGGYSATGLKLMVTKLEEIK